MYRVGGDQSEASSVYWSALLNLRSKGTALCKKFFLLKMVIPIPLIRKYGLSWIHLGSVQFLFKIILYLQVSKTKEL